ncbi:insulinase family protein [Streptomyces sp. G44]|uniref:M16 family metallopeptidase n=1 Tax=Streptomyces sp. G44 TaxID=2807632 RepID=UPI00195F5584|nr:insulinase family protein [Streptomyces sp. G44]MBM7167705.1 insulinase family protein [Streptomyces sp. G44]
MNAPGLPNSPDLITHTGSNNLTVTASALATVPLVQAHLAIPLPLRDANDLAVLDVLAACWPDLPACARFEQHGGTVGISRRNQWLMLSLSCTADRLLLLAETLTAIVAAAYTPDLVGGAVSKSVQQAGLVDAQPGVYSIRRMWELYYGHLPAFADPAPRLDLVSKVTADQVADAHRRHLSPHDAHLVIVGDLEPNQAATILGDALAHWSAPSSDDTAFRAPARAANRLIVDDDRPEWRQSHIRLAAASPTRQDQRAFAAAQIASLVLGGSLSSRITTTLREEKGLAYRASASLTDHLDQDLLVIEADVDPVGSREAMTLLSKLLADFATEGPTEHELATAVTYIAGKYALNLGSQGGRAACVLSYLTAGIPLAGISGLIEDMKALTREDVRSAAAFYHPDQVSGLICGPQP